MKHKEPWLVPAVTTWKAMKKSIQECAPIFCIENPLYSEICPNLPEESFSEYRVEVFSEKQVIMLTKIKGENTFQEHKYEPYYLPFLWKSWHS